ncbi:MAG: hypothetical protein ABJD11_13520 [Gemmatimonadota bacterium]
MAEAAERSLASSAGVPQPLLDRVRARVLEVGIALDRRDRASRPKSRRGRKPTIAAPETAGVDGAAPAPELTRETRSFRGVFREMGHTHRQHRLRTGQHVPVPLREAARAFRAQPSLESLVLVAAFLDEDGLLAW